MRLPMDPEGYYARLEVEPSARSEAITAAYRRKARLVHPDVPVTGNASAFVELKQAYDVLIHIQRRAAYDRSARQPQQVPPSRAASYDPGTDDPGEIGAKPFPAMATPPTRHPRLRDLPIVVWVGMAALLMVGVVEVGLHLTSSPAQEKHETIPATAWDVPPLPANEPAPALYGPTPVHLAGTPNFYIVPTASAAILWRVDEARHTLVPWGQLPAFSS
ncbi:MAG TPA: J domain-containing protein, partial [Acetobacteraceae bacterium]|nr:J domain-containing protein [Acetobacteraceae bacterium]